MFAVCMVCACLWMGVRPQAAPATLTSQGRVIGVQEGKHMAFYGIPYGAPTSKENRFKPPTPAPPFSQDFNATNNSIKCAQVAEDRIVGVEDCLVLNIHTKSFATPKPVVVVIEGEGYETTRPELRNITYDNLVNNDLVVVYLNYRLTIFGFLCLRVPEAPGNMGLMDIILGLKWIKRNIINFGGDARNVVILGHGSGAALADILTLSPMAQGLIHKAIILSGSALAPWAVSYSNTRNAYSVGSKLGYHNKTKYELARALADLDKDTLSYIVTKMKSSNNAPIFAPCVDNVLPNDPIYILRSKTFNHIPYLAGYTDNEGTIIAEEIVNGTWLETLHKNFTQLLPEDITFESEDDEIEVTKRVRDLYFPISTSELGKSINDSLKYAGDILQIIPLLRSVKERALSSDAKNFIFEFQFKATEDIESPYADVVFGGVKHGDILNLLLNYGIGDVPASFKEIFWQRFVKFAYTGLPELDIARYTSWLPVTEQYFYCLAIFGKAQSHYGTGQNPDPYLKQRKFWDDIYSKYYRHLKSSGHSIGGCGVMLLYLICTLILTQDEYV